MPEMCGAREMGGRSEVEVVLCRDTEPELGYNETGSKGHHSPGAAASPGCSLYKNNLISLSFTHDPGAVSPPALSPPVPPPHVLLWSGVLGLALFLFSQ